MLRFIYSRPENAAQTKFLYFCRMSLNLYSLNILYIYKITSIRQHSTTASEDNLLFIRERERNLESNKYTKNNCI